MSKEFKPLVSKKYYIRLINKDDNNFERNPGFLYYSQIPKEFENAIDDLKIFLKSANFIEKRELITADEMNKKVEYKVECETFALHPLYFYDYNPHNVPLKSTAQLTKFIDITPQLMEIFFKIWASFVFAKEFFLNPYEDLKINYKKYIKYSKIAYLL